MRRSINVENFNHGAQPIPAASRVGNIIVTGGVYGLDPKTGKVPDDLEQQTALMFENLRRILAEAGSSFEQVAKMTFWVRTPEVRSAINPAWLAAFPNAESRPARHTLQNDHLPLNLLIQCDALAVATDT